MYVFNVVEKMSKKIKIVFSPTNYEGLVVSEHHIPKMIVTVTNTMVMDKFGYSHLHRKYIIREEKLVQLV